MSNPYYSFSANVVAGTTIRADKYNSDQQAIETAFDALALVTDKVLLLPNTFTGNKQIPEKTTENTFVFINNDGDADLYPVTTLFSQIDTVNTQYGEIATWYTDIISAEASSTNKALLASQYATYPSGELIPGTSDYSAFHWAKEAETFANGSIIISQQSADFTASRLARVTEYVIDATANVTVTIDETTYAANEKLIIQKSQSQGQLTITSGENISLPDGTSGASHFIPDGFDGTINLTFNSDKTSQLRIY